MPDIKTTPSQKGGGVGVWDAKIEQRQIYDQAADTKKYNVSECLKALRDHAQLKFEFLYAVQNNVTCVV